MTVPGTVASGSVGLALGGGAARGLAHIGVLKVLQEEGIPIDFIAGTSAGSLVGAAFAAGLSWRDILETARGIDWLDIASPVFPRMGLMKMDRLQNLLERTLGERTFDSLSIPLSIVTVDIVSGDQIVLCGGSVARAVRASCSIPGIFEPVVEGAQRLVDGGLLNNMPVDVVRHMGAETVIGVDLSSDRRHVDPPRNMLDVLLYSFDTLVDNNARRSFESTDIIITPQLDGYSPRDFRKIDELVALGEKSMQTKLGVLRETLATNDHAYLGKSGIQGG
jgi:NTE family protein